MTTDAFLTRQTLSHFEQMQDAQNQCVPCKLCGGSAIISDAGPGAGYYIRCKNSGTFRANDGCMVDDLRLSGWAYNVMEWWNRLHAHQPIQAAESGLLDEALEALRKCMDQFLFYETSHRAKGTVDGYSKAETNREMADMCDAVLAKAGKPGEAGNGQG